MGSRARRALPMALIATLVTALVLLLVSVQADHGAAAPSPRRTCTAPVAARITAFVQVLRAAARVDRDMTDGELDAISLSAGRAHADFQTYFQAHPECAGTHADLAAEAAWASFTEQWNLLFTKTSAP